MKPLVIGPVVIVGAGLVGASIGMALESSGIKVHLVDAVASHARVAESLGAGTTQPPEGKVRLVVVAVPPDALADVIAGALETYPRATVTDVGSVKGTVLGILRGRGVALGRYVGSHPMAGSQHAGPITARADLFAERTWVVCPHDTASAQAVLVVQELARLCGSRIITLGPAHHDEAVAQVSHLPQLVASLVAGTLNDVPPEHLKLAGQGLRDVTRIAGSESRLWRQIIGANREAVRAQVRRFGDALDELMAALDLPDAESDEALEGALEWGRTGVRLLPGKHGSPVAEFAHVVVEIPDTQGALARLFADIEAAGVNVEDVAIEHDTAREVGWLSVGVAEQRASQLEDAMTSAGWTVRH